jgi:hypothetical protein
VKDGILVDNQTTGTADWHLTDRRVQSRMELTQFAGSIFGRPSGAERYGNELNAVRVFHSSRKAVRGSTRVARCAGM